MDEAWDLAAARFLRTQAIEMHLEEGHSRERAEVLAEDLLRSEVVFELPESWFITDPEFPSK